MEITQVQKARKALNQLARKLLLLKSGLKKKIRNEMIDNILDSEDGEIPILSKFIREMGNKSKK